jgi:beta-phosphoglucomutase-like phosphatase (HAD superfamily)
VVSSRRLAALHRGLAATGLGGHFPVVIGLDDVTTPKPSPEGLILALERLGGWCEAGVQGRPDASPGGSLMTPYSRREIAVSARV